MLYLSTSLLFVSFSFSLHAQTCQEHVSQILLSQQLLVFPPTQSTINNSTMSCRLHKAQPVLIHVGGQICNILLKLYVSRRKFIVKVSCRIKTSDQIRAESFVHPGALSLWMISPQFEPVKLELWCIYYTFYCMSVDFHTVLETLLAYLCKLQWKFGFTEIPTSSIHYHHHYNHLFFHMYHSFTSEWKFKNCLVVLLVWSGCGWKSMMSHFHTPIGIY